MNNVPVIREEKREQARDLITLVSFHLDNGEYGVDVLKVREIIRMVNVTHIPNTPAHVQGIINLRGKVVPILSMRKKFGLVNVENNSQTRIIIMNIEGKQFGFAVDSVSEVILVAAAEIQPPPPIATGCPGQELIAGVINRSNKLLVLLDLDHAFMDGEREQYERL